MHRRQSSSLMTRGSRNTLIPALFTRMSGVPNVARAASYIAATEAGSATSVAANTARRPALTSSDAIAAPVASLISATTTEAPSAAKQRAIAAPMPWPAPVTTAIFPASRPVMAL